MLPPLSAFVRSALPARRALATAPLTRARFLHATRSALASEPNSLAAFKNHPMMQQISGSPDAMAAISKFVGLLQAKGIKLDGGKPSMMTMGRIMMDSEVRESAKQVSEALQKAGINFGSKEAMAFMEAAMGPKKP